MANITTLILFSVVSAGKLKDLFGSPTGFFLKFSRACKTPFYLAVEVEMGVFHLEL